MVHIQSNNSNAKFDDANKKREDELRHIQEIREHLEWKLACTNQLFVDASNMFNDLKLEKDRLRYIF